jgi:D-arabinose 1-dehydrogenase
MEFIPHFYERAKVGQLVAASPLSMGLLTPSPPAWHPAPPALQESVTNARKTWEGDFPNLAVGYSIRQTGSVETPLPLVVGFSNPREVHECMKVWREIQAAPEDGGKRKEGEERAREVFRLAGYLDWSWASP